MNNYSCTEKVSYILQNRYNVAGGFRLPSHNSDYIPPCLLQTRVMDEFDVFMDAQVRNIAIKQIMTFAQRSGKSRQMILITPQVS